MNTATRISSSSIDSALKNRPADILDWIVEQYLRNDSCEGLDNFDLLFEGYILSALNGDFNDAGDRLHDTCWTSIDGGKTVNKNRDGYALVIGYAFLRDHVFAKEAAAAYLEAL